MSNKLQSATKEFRGLLAIPLVIRWTTGTPAIVANPMNEAITLTDVGTGDVLLTLTNASLAPLIVGGSAVLGGTASAKLGSLNLKAAPTATAVALVYKETTVTAPDNVAVAAADPVDVHVILYKTIAN